MDAWRQAKPEISMACGKLDMVSPAATRQALATPCDGHAPELPLVLKGLTVTFPRGMKTGIVVRTESARSTLIQAEEVKMVLSSTQLLRLSCRQCQKKY